MKKLFLAVAGLALTLSAAARPVDPDVAHQAAQRFLQHTRPEAQLALTATFDYEGNAGVFVFNIDDDGFILVSADDAAVPILGYSFEGPYIEATAAPAARAWFAGYAREIAHLAAADLPADPEWKRLLTKGPDDDPTKADSYLLTSKWGQGWGYNYYCPEFRNGQNAVTGCVATAMAQIIRYYAFPTHGFDSSSYRHSYYGIQYANYKNATYDFSNMPDELGYSSSQAQIEAVALLNYHCGVSVKMEYQWPNHPDGSGAQSENVPGALKYFGYFRAKHKHMSSVDDTTWYSLLRNEIDNLRPVYYSGNDGEGGHAFVCDGYSSNGNRFHFNWGWSGASNGFFALKAGASGRVIDYVYNQDAVYNIIPSQISSHVTDQFFVDPVGGGDGSSWSSCNHNLIDLIPYATSKHIPIWMKEGTYTTDDGNAVLSTQPGTVIYGGFAGTETSLEERQPDMHPTILDGENTYRVIDTRGDTTGNTYLRNLVITHAGDIEYGAARLGRNVVIENCTFTDNHLDSNTMMQMDRTTMRYCRFINNQAPLLINEVRGNIYSSLFVGNSGNLADINNAGTMISCTVQGSGDRAVRLITSRGKVNSSVIIGYDTAVVAMDTAGAKVDYCALQQPCNGEGNILLEGEWPDLGTRLFAAEGDFHLSQSSPLVNAGTPNYRDVSDLDLDGLPRVENGRTDIGCYESTFLGISNVEASQMSVSPNPTTGRVTIGGLAVGTEVRLLTLTGITVATRRSTDDGAVFDLSTLPAGLYIVCTPEANQRLLYIK